MVDEFNAVRFGAKGWRLLTRHSVEMNEIVEIRMNMSLMNNQNYIKPIKHPQFQLNIYYGREKIKEIEKEGMSCE